MALSAQDRIDITDLVNGHGHVTDAGELDRYAELFTPDVTYDVTDFGLGAIHGLTALRDGARALGDANPVGHHVTNIVITGVDDGEARVRSKGIGVMAGGTAGSVTYEDVVTRGAEGWKISHRKVIRRRRPLGGGDGPREVLERWRAAAISQSIEDYARLFAPDAVHEFPFTRPGLPSRLVGRDEIVAWSAGAWRTGGFKYDAYRTIAVHDTGDPATIVVEQDALGTSAVTGEFALPNIIVLTVRDGLIVHLRDYVNVAAAMAALRGES